MCLRLRTTGGKSDSAGHSGLICCCYSTLKRACSYPSRFLNV